MNNKFYGNIFKWLFLGLLVTFGVALFISTNNNIINYAFNKGLYYIILIVQIVLAIVLSVRIFKMNKLTAKIIYILYAGLTGITFSFIFLAFNLESIIFVLLASSIVFGIFGLIGTYTNIDLSKISTYLFMGLLAVILLEVINIFMLNNTLNMITSIISLLVFMGYVAYDMQKIKRIYYKFGNDNFAILGAFELYLDFVNIFLDLLNLFGREKN